MRPLAVQAAGLMTSVGQHTAAAGAALRCRFNDFRHTDLYHEGRPITAGAVAAVDEYRGLSRLAALLRPALAQVLNAPAPDPARLPVVLCVAPTRRPGRLAHLDDGLFQHLVDHLGARPPVAHIVRAGHNAITPALALAETLLYDEGYTSVLVAGADSLLNRRTLTALVRAGRVRAGRVSDGVIPGQAGAALLLGRPTPQSALSVLGLGRSREAARPDNDLPLTGDGLTLAMDAALTDAGRSAAHLGVRIADYAGEVFHAQEATLAAQRVLSGARTLPLWLPAESLGDTGAAVGLIALAWLDQAVHRGYLGAPGLCHLADDDGRRGAFVAGPVDWRPG